MIEECRQNAAVGKQIAIIHSNPPCAKGTHPRHRTYLSAHGFSPFQDRGPRAGQRAGAGVFALLPDKAGIPVEGSGGNLSGQYAGSVLSLTKSPQNRIDGLPAHSPFQTVKKGR